MPRSKARDLPDLEAPPEPVLDPFAALDDIASDAMALVEVMRRKVSRLDDVGYSSSMGLEQVKAELQVYLSALTRAESVLSKIVSLGLDTRRVRLEEAKAALVVGAVEKVLSHKEVALSPAQQRTARSLLVKELRPALVA